MKTILVPLTGQPHDNRAATAAFLAAARFGAHVEGLCVIPPVEIRTSVEHAAIPAALADELVRIGRADQAAALDGAHLVFDAVRGRFAVSAAWRPVTGLLPDIIAEEGRLADLVVMAQPADGSGALAPAIEAALFASGRPLLLAPAGEPATLGGAVAVAWDGGTAAARAVALALPLLRRAGRVVILAAENPAPGRVADPARLSANLARHGVSALIHPLSPAGRGISRALLDAALEEGADVMVMGAYGHSRVREMVWGGVTRDILREPPPLSVLLAH
ncbi:nucleotide-binding universal stress UspA family protein [Azospirillum fermentarium]|uniref:universal stress protein n=1 Tax=Azospirillum fermentarium TaxID=1233114 RepID=UPI002227A0CF|nr:universal stress protein [Azospirillum fermentarium]MCW2247678.1 nucleotide-binding universal stress UspA family protein [Azospirillum fermentarium]